MTNYSFDGQMYGDNGYPDDTWDSVEMYLEPKGYEMTVAEATTMLQSLLQSLLEQLTESTLSTRYIGQPVKHVPPDLEPITSELGSTYAALLAFSAARGKDEHPATLIKALVYGLVRYHHTAYLQDAPNVEPMPAGDFTIPMHEILEMAEDYNVRIYDEDDENAEPDPDHGQYATNIQQYPITSEEYRRSRGGRCPQCGSEETEGSSCDIEGESIAQQILCQECGAAWYDMYKLIGYDMIEKDKKTNETHGRDQA